MNKSGCSKVARAIELTINGEYYMIERTTRNNRHYTWKSIHDPSTKKHVVASPPPMTLNEGVVEMEAFAPCLLLDDLNPRSLPDFIDTDIVAPGTIPFHGFCDDSVTDSVASMDEMLTFGF